MVPTPETNRNPENAKEKLALTDFKSKLETARKDVTESREKSEIDRNLEKLFESFVSLLEQFAPKLRTGKPEDRKEVEDAILGQFSAAEGQKILKIFVAGMESTQQARGELFALAKEVTPGQTTPVIPTSIAGLEGKFTDFIKGAKEKGGNAANVIAMIGEDNVLAFAKGMLASFLESMAKFAPNIGLQSAEIRWANEMSGAKKNAALLGEVNANGGEEKVKQVWLDKYMDWIQQKAGNDSFKGAMPTLRTALKAMKDEKERKEKKQEPKPAEQAPQSVKERDVISNAKVEPGMTMSLNSGAITIEHAGKKSTLAVKNAKDEAQSITKATMLAKAKESDADTLRLILTDGKTVDVQASVIDAELKKTDRKPLQIGDSKIELTTQIK